MTDRPTTILVVEDNPVTRKLFRVTLEGAGYRVVEAEDGRTALELVPREAPDLILQDLRLPDMDGLELAGRIRALPQGLELTIIAVSGLLSGIEAGRASFDDFLAKPVEPSRLLETVGVHLASRPAAPPTRASGRHVVIADDDPMQRKLLALRLTHLGFAVDAVGDGAAALERVRRQPPDAVVSDILMPELDGFGLCLAIRQDPRTAHVPVVLTSSSCVEQADRELAAKVGADAYVLRTPDFRAVMDALQESLGRARRPPPAALPEAIAGEHFQRVLRQIERQAAMNATVSERNARLTAELAALVGISEVLTQVRDARAAAREILARCLEAGGVSKGILYLDGPDDALRLAAAIGFPESLQADLDGFFGHAALLRQLAAGKSVVTVPSDVVPAEAAREILERSGLTSLLVAPVPVHGQAAGALVLGSDAGELDAVMGAGFARTVAVQIGQALALTAEIAERRRAEEKYRGIFENAVVGIFQKTLDGRYLIANPTLARMYGYGSPEELMASVTDVSRQFYVEPGRRAEFIRLVQEHGEVSSFESRIYRKDGSVMWISEEARALRDVEGRLVGFEGTTKDVTARRYAEEARERLVAILEVTPEFVGIADVEGRVVYLNRGGRRLMGFGEDEDLSGFRVAEGHPEGARKLLLERAIPTAVRDGVWAGESTLLTRDGREIPVWQTLLAHRGPGGAVQFISTIMHDLSQRRQLEEQLRLAQKMEAVGTLAGGVAHDFNNLLAAIRSTVDLALLDLEAESPVREDLGEVGGLVDRAAALTRQLLAFGRKQVLDPHAVDLNALLSGTVKMLERIIGEDIRLVLHQTSDPTTVLADPGQIEQVLMNLCANARDAMPDGGELAILTERVLLDEHFSESHPWARPGDYVRLTVSDAGVGMDAATQARIFEPFFTTKEMGRGTGLGLAVVYGIVKQHSGLIHVYSEPGKGTTFRVYLPFHPGAPEAVAAEAAAQVVGGTETVLLAEDDDVLRVTATRLLERLGYRVIAAANGRAAVDVLTQEDDTIHLAILDVVMPEMPGPVVVEQVRPRYPKLRFLLTTGYSPGTSHMTPVQDLPATVLPKPYGLRELARAVRRALDTERHGRG